MVDIQNATLAGRLRLPSVCDLFTLYNTNCNHFLGGVAVGASANFILHPWGAILLGFSAGKTLVHFNAILFPHHLAQVSLVLWGSLM